LNSKEVDIDYQNEYLSCKQLGVETGLINYELLVDFDDPVKAVQSIEKVPNTEKAIYRGWMMKPEKYRELYEILLSKNILLINTPAMYIHCHYRPEAYAEFQGHTPKTLWLSKLEFGENLENVWGLFGSFGASPVIIKDYVKSRKYEWH
jgi:hypothetical protein